MMALLRDLISAIRELTDELRRVRQSRETLRMHRLASLQSTRQRHG